MPARRSRPGRTALGQILTRARTRKGLTQTALGALIGVSRGRIAAWEYASVPPTKLIRRLADTLDLNRDELLSMVEHQVSGEADTPEVIAPTPEGKEVTIEVKGGIRLTIPIPIRVRIVLIEPMDAAP